MSTSTCLKFERKHKCIFTSVCFHHMHFHIDAGQYGVILLLLLNNLLCMQILGTLWREVYNRLYISLSHYHYTDSSTLGAVCAHLFPFWWLREYFTSFYHHQEFRNMNHWPLLSLMSWHNGVRCTACYFIVVWVQSWIKVVCLTVAIQCYRDWFP